MSKKNIAEVIEELLAYSQKKLSLKAEDVHFVRNALLFELKVVEPSAAKTTFGKLQEDILDPIAQYAIENRLCTEYEKILFETKIIGLILPMPSAVRAQFDTHCIKGGVQKALTWFNNFCIDCNYIRMVDIDKNIYWEHNGYLGEIGITINLSKPEKDAKEIAAALAVKKASYPACMLCPSNVGYYGNLSHPARQTLRTIPILLNNEPWHFQYSPYMYFEEHCIALSDEHRIMKVDSSTYMRLFDFVELFPNYFIGSNAALPIVGGSILSHDHYQGGLKVLPVMKSKAKYSFTNRDFSDVTCDILQWYNSVIRLTSQNRESLLKCIDFISNKWNVYTDESVGVICATKAQHNAITPIARMENGVYVIDMILRNNRTDAKHPYGIYHPTEDLHNIKKEGIGLIEAMGRFILPGRLKNEAEGIKSYLTGKTALNFKEIASEDNPMSKHLGMIAQLVNDYGTSLTEEKAGEFITEYINNACVRILECTAVFKNDAEGQVAFIKFINSCGFRDVSGVATEISVQQSIPEITPIKTISVYDSSKPIVTTTVEPKKRGRKPNSEKEKIFFATVKKESAIEKETASTEGEVKRGRGRPRKIY